MYVCMFFACFRFSRPHVILCNGITLKPSMYTMLIGSDESDA